MPPSRVERMVAISVLGTEAQLTTRSQSAPVGGLRTASITSTARVASTRSAHVAERRCPARPSSAFCEMSRASSWPLPPAALPGLRQAERAALPRARARATVIPGPHVRADQRRRTAHVERGEGQGVGHVRRQPGVDARWRRGWRARARRPGRSPSWTAFTSSITSGVSERLTSVAIRSPGLSCPVRRVLRADLRGRGQCSIPPEPVTGFCIFPRAWTISWMRRDHRLGRPVARLA